MCVLKIWGRCCYVGGGFVSLRQRVSSIVIVSHDCGDKLHPFDTTLFGLRAVAAVK